MRKGEEEADLAGVNLVGDQFSLLSLVHSLTRETGSNESCHGKNVCVTC